MLRRARKSSSNGCYMRVYHFTKAVYGLEAIRRRRLKIARISELNDPFEFLQVASRNPKTRARYQYVKRALSEYMGLLCFSENWSNPVQWSHYANSHCGICLGFDVVSSAEMQKVRYVKNRIRPNLRAMKAMGDAAVAHMLDHLTTWERNLIQCVLSETRTVDLTNVDSSHAASGARDRSSAAKPITFRTSHGGFRFALPTRS